MRIVAVVSSVVIVSAFLAGSALGAINDPTEIADLALWLDGNDMDADGIDDGVDPDTAWSVPDGIRIRRWKDRSANAHVFERTGSGERPLLRVGDLAAGRGAALFDGSDDILLCTDAASTSSAGTLFIVFRTPSTIVSSGKLFVEASDSVNDLHVTPLFVIRDSDTHAFAWSQSFNGVSTETPDYGLDFANSSSYVTMVRHDGTDTYLSIDGGTEGQASGAGETPRWFDDVAVDNSSVGAHSRNGLEGGFYAGHVAAVVLYDRELTSLEIDDVEAYLTARHLQAAAAIAFDDPTDIGDLALWLDGNDLDADGTDDDRQSAASLTDALVGGTGPVHTWSDKSGNSIDVTQSDSDERPSRTVGDLAAFRGAVVFDGTDDYLHNTEAASTNSLGTLFLVFKTPATIANGKPFVEASDTISDVHVTPLFVIKVTDTQAHAYSQSFNGASGIFSDYGFDFANSTSHVVTVTHYGDAATLSIDGGAKAVASPENRWFDDVAVDNTSVGAENRNGGETSHYSGHIAAVVLYDRVLGYLQVPEVEAYLIARHLQGRPISGTVVWFR